MKLSLLFFASCFILQAAMILASKEVKIEGTVFCDNYCQLFVAEKNKKPQLLVEDPRFVQHTAFSFSFDYKPNKQYRISALIEDQSDENALEWGKRCIGGGGFRLITNDNFLFTNASWKCRTISFGPLNKEECYGAGLDWTGFAGGARARALARPFDPSPACKDNPQFNTPVTQPRMGDDGNVYSYTPCIQKIFKWYGKQTTVRPGTNYRVATDSAGRAIKADWAQYKFDDEDWDEAIEYPDSVAGWGGAPIPSGQPGGRPFEGNDADTIWGPAQRYPNELISEEFGPDLKPITSVIPSTDINWGPSKFIWSAGHREANAIVCSFVFGD